MSIDRIGKQIAFLRKEKGCKQDELAKFVGVSPQAVSKWENGGIPDTELLPKIADFFSVTVDFLFGRNITDGNYLRMALGQKILDAPEEQRCKMVLEHCWDMEKALAGHQSTEGETIAEMEPDIGPEKWHYSSVLTDYGFTRMGLGSRLQYFLLALESPDTDLAFFEGINYPTFFRDFSEQKVFEACVLLNKRQQDKAFTEKLLMKQLQIELDEAKHILAVLKKYRLLKELEMEMDDETQTIYTFIPTPSFIALLIFAKEMIQPPNSFSYYNHLRSKPYLK